MIDINNVSKFYGDFQALKNCTAKVSKGEVIVVCGPSGSGKSTLIKCINALEKFDDGSITVGNLSVGAKGTDLPNLRRQVGMVFQSFELFPHLTVMDNLVIPQREVLKLDRQTAKLKGEALLTRVGLLEQADKYPLQLSGGQQQRVAIARALAMEPQAMLFDEPTSALDPEMVAEVLAVMAELAGDGMTMFCVTHELGFARRIADRILFMDAGEIIEDASTEEFFSAPKSTRAQEFLKQVLSH